MEALAAVSVAANVIQFVDFAGKLITKTARIYRSESQARSLQPEDPSDLGTITRGLEKFNKELSDSLNTHYASPPLQMAEADKEILRICDDCKTLTSRLSEALGRLKSSKPTMWTSFMLALRTIWSEDEVNALRQTLDSYRQQLSLYLLAAVRCEIQQFQLSQAQMTTTVENTRKVVEDFFLKLQVEDRWEHDVMRVMRQDYATRTHRDVSHKSPAEGWHHQISGEDIARFQDGLLDWLHFTELDTRHEKISAAYSRTFEWVFRDPPNNEWSNFSDWLTNEDQPLYWITGKPAAGKSTLMKYIYTHPRTKDRLEAWARGKQLVICAYYFWNAGSHMQMSQQGMARTLLYSALQQAPELWKVLFPHYMEQYIAFPYPWQRPISWNEIMRALRALVKEAGRSYRLFFFIDGLDEFDGDHSQLIDMLCELESPEVKTCVSSRPWNIFQDTFGQRPSLRLEDLTYDDIKLYVEEKFSAIPGFHERQRETPTETAELVEDITRKAAGVFLWVTLVTDSLIEGLSDGDRLTDLRTRLDALPADLETLFWSIINRLGTSHFSHTAQLLQILRASSRAIGLLMLSYADEDDSEYAAKIIANPPSPEQKTARAEILRRRLNACCKGLLEAKTTGDTLIINTEVGYLHRTVKDFVERPDIWSKLLEKTSESFNPYVRLCNAHSLMITTVAVESLSTEARKVRYHAIYAIKCASQVEIKNDENDRKLHAGLSDLLSKSLKSLRSRPDLLSSSLLLATIGYSHLADGNDTRLDELCDRPNVDVIKLFLENGAEPNREIPSIALKFGLATQPATISPWQACLEVYTHFFTYAGTELRPEVHNHRILFLKISKLYLAYGADPKLVSSSFPGEVFALAQQKIKEKRIKKKEGRSKKLKELLAKITL